MSPDTLSEIQKAVLQGEDDSALDLIRQALAASISPLAIINEAIVPGIVEAGYLWNKGIYFLPEVVLSAETFREAMGLLAPLISPHEVKTAGKIVIGTVAGDVHTLGKRIVVTMLQAAGYEVVDLGEDVPNTTFINRVREYQPDILGLGSYMTTTNRAMEEIIRNLEANGLRSQVKVLIGGASTSQEYASKIGADAWGRDAVDAVAKARHLIRNKPK